MAGGRRFSNESLDRENSVLDKIKKNINFTTVLIAITVIVVIIGIVSTIKHFSNSNKPSEETVSQNENFMIEDVDGYKVLGKIIIEKINVEQYILDSKEDNALEKGVTKLYGGNLNEKGNFCIAGHNKENVFQNLGELEKGDTLKIIDKDLKETKYEITDIYSVEPDDLKCLISNDENVEITLITCENESTTRLVVKAQEINN